MILISLFIQINSTDNETSIKKFVYLMINDFKRQEQHQEINNIKEIKIFNCLKITKKSLLNQQSSSQKTKDFD